ncbi:hypothetical protein I2W78_20610 [Streptomyces spinoverrucosus]|uniref:hypothetical protein n=1 Tax=Streptomyces spinoverrucosus TaxID=284043 RepID=UPI0018C424BC|nr:hypothetical protein [Streptomyces spinoverrucosus]MBG0854175.1 hypothetical protein [Streptomyces spinoverrucosus]
MAPVQQRVITTARARAEDAFAAYSERRLVIAYAATLTVEAGLLAWGIATTAP